MIPTRSWLTRPGIQRAMALAGLTAGMVLTLILSGCKSSIGPRTGMLPALERADGSSKRAPDGSLPSLDEELWVIARGETPAPAAADEDPGTGAMLSRDAETGLEIPLPLKHTDVKATISGYIAAVTVLQEFQNPFDGRIEARYVFPLPQNAAVSGFIMVIGDRRIRGIIRERQEAEQIYREARRQGYVASLLTQERPNVFTQSVANIEPGREIAVRITYFHTLVYDDGWYEFVFPMVVGPRFNPPGWTSGVGAVARGQPGRSQQPVEVEYLKPGERSRHEIALEVEIDAGVAIEEIRCSSHRILRNTVAPDRATIALSPDDRIPNRDFVLRYRVVGDRIKSDVLTHRDERGGYFTLMLYPPSALEPVRRQPLELVFVLDCSGSMSGRPIEQAKGAIDRALQRLEPDDTFQLIRFSNAASQLGSNPLPATPENIGQARQYLESLRGQGGTMMLEGIRAALNFPHDSSRLRFVCFLTDGYIGNEIEILGEIQRRLGASRIFSFGVGSSVNRYLMDRMAKIGRGAVAYLGPNDSPVEVMDWFLGRIRHPALTDLSIDWGGAQVTDVYPQRVPDLFAGRPVILTGRFQGGFDGPVRIRGLAQGEPIILTVPLDTADAVSTHPALPSVWARMKIAELSDRATFEPAEELAREIKQVALDHGLMSAYTAFVAVDSSRRTGGSEGTTVPVAVPVPEGVKYETTVEE